MMIKAWLCYPFIYDDDDEEPVIKFTEPDRYHSYSKIVEIAYVELKELGDT